MRRKNLWLAAGLVALGTTAGVLAFHFGQRHPDTVAAVMAVVNPNPVTMASRLLGYQAEHGVKEAAHCKVHKPEPAAVGNPAEESSEPVPVDADEHSPHTTVFIELHNVQAADAAAVLQAFFANDKDVVIIAEPESNKLMVSLTPDNCDLLGYVVNAIDVPPMQSNDNQSTRKTEIIGLLYAEAPDAAKGLQTLLDNVCQEPKPDVQIVAEPVSNKLLVSIPSDNYYEVMQLVVKLIKAIDVRPRQVQIDVLIAEVECTDDQVGLGVFGDGESSCTMPNDKFEALLADLQKQGRLHTVAAPQLTTIDNQSARILVGQSFPYVSGTTPSSTTDAPAITNTIAYRDIGVQVQVTPKISPDGTVVMRIVPEISTAVPSTIQIANGVFATAFDVQTLETTVLIKDGETAVIGGMIRTSDAGSPWFWFRQNQKTEMVVFVTPHVAHEQP